MAEENDDFFLEDREAIEAAERLRSLGTSSPAVIISASASARRFRVEHKHLKDAVRTATLKDKIKEADVLHFAVGDGLIELYAQFKGVETWVRVQQGGSQASVEKPLNFNLPHTTAQRLVALEGIGTLDAQILLDGTAPDQCCRNVRKFLPWRRPHVPSRPREFHPEPLTDSGRDTLASSGSCHRTKAAAFR
jgi:hypothetical protein